MINKNFEAYKITRELRRSGVEYPVFRKVKNIFGEPTNEEMQVCLLFGLYHEENSFVKIKTGETTQIRNKKQPRILCLFESTCNIETGDIIRINNKTYKVAAITNIQEWNIVADISLEEVMLNVTTN